MEHYKSEFVVEEFVWSPIAPTTSFNHIKGEDPLKKMIELRRSHKEITQFVWITLAPVVSDYRCLYNPQAPILLILN